MNSVRISVWSKIGICLAATTAYILAFPRQAQEQPRRWTHPISPVHISGSFSEYRHYGRYHPGLDYKTFNRTGLTVVTPEDAYVENIHIADTGYGNALFLRDTSGEVLVFAHLQDFLGEKPELEAFRQAVLLMRTEPQTFFAIPAWFSFQKGNRIARSGESGVGAPHLHFEIRSPEAFIDPLSLPGMSVHDHTAPQILTLYAEVDGRVISFPCERIDALPDSETEPTIHRYRVHSGAVVIPARWNSLRFQAGAFDTMATRNINGVYGMSLSAGGNVLFDRVFDRILFRDFSNAAAVYNTALTVVGREYVYLLYDTNGVQRGTIAPSQIASLSRSSEQNPGMPFQIRIFDSERNTAVLDFEVRLDLAPASPVRETESYQIVPSEGASTLRYASGNTSMELQFVRDSLIYPGKIRFRQLDELPAERLNTRTGEKPYSSTGTGILVEGQDLYYRNGATAVVTMPDTGDPRLALYIFNRTTNRWRILALPALRSQGRILYRFNFRTTGPIAQLVDETPPEFERPMLWEDPPADANYRRSFQLRERGTGIKAGNCSILLDGLALPFEWDEDRSAISVDIPAELISDQGSVLSLQAGDAVNNRSAWHFEFIEKRPRQRSP